MTDETVVSDDVRQAREDEAFIKDFVSRGAGGEGASSSDDTPSGLPKKADAKATPKEPKQDSKKHATKEATLAAEIETPDDEDDEHLEHTPDSDVDDDTDLDAPTDEEESAEHPETDSETQETQGREKKTFLDALETEGVSFTKLLADVPEEYRPLLEKKAKELQAGFTKARQTDRGQFKDTVTLRAEMRLLSERPADVIVEKILKDPKLAEAINAKLDQLDKMDQLDGTPGSAASAHQESVKRARETAVTTEQGEAVKADTEARKIEAITQAGMRAARAAGVPFQAGVEDAIAAQLALGNLNITVEQIEQIAKEKAAVYERSVRAVRREATKGYVKKKVADRRTAGLVVKPNSGHTVAPSAKAGPQNDDEFVAHMRDKYK